MSTQQLYTDFSGVLASAYGAPVNDFSEYHDHPVEFCMEVLGDKYLTEDTQRLMMSVVDNQVTLGKSGNGTGKSFSGARIALWFYLVRKGQVYLAAAPPLSNLQNILFGEIFTIVNKRPKVFEYSAQKSMHLQMSPSHFLTGLSIPSSGTKEQRIAKFSGKHHKNGVLFVNDEASAIPGECFQGEETCASDDKSRILAIFNPHNKAGWTYRAERDGHANIVSLSALNHVQVVKGRDDITPGAVTRNKTVLRINQWCRPLAEGESVGPATFELPDFLEGVTCVDQKKQTLPPLVPGHYKIVEPSFSTIVLGEYPSAASNTLISQEWIDAARSRYDLYLISNGLEPPEYVNGTAGLDVAEEGKDLSCLCFKYGGFVPPLISWGGVDMAVTEARCASEVAGKDIARINVDATGLGSGVAPHLIKDHNLPAVSVKVAKSPTETSEFGNFKLLNDQLAWKVRLWLRDDNTAMLPPDEQLLEELAIYTYSVGDDGLVRVSPKSLIKPLLGRSPDKFDALKLNFHTDGKFNGVDLS